MRNKSFVLVTEIWGCMSQQLMLPVLTNTGIESLIIHQKLFSVHYIPSTILGARNIVISKLDMVPTLRTFSSMTTQI